MEQVKILDTTLRDGEQTAGVAFTPAEKMQIAKMLDELGVHQIEAGIPAMGGDELDAIAGILSMGLKAKISAWNRANVEDIKKSINCGVKNIHISAPVSDIHIKYKLRKSRQWVLDNIVKTINYAKERNCWVSVGAEDASRADMKFLIEFVQLVQKNGVQQFRYADTVGKLDPFQTYENVKTLIENTDLDIEIHTHNDFGMATANSLAAIKAGAKFVNTTINGIGERAGNASFEEVISALQYVYKYQISIDTKKLAELVQYVAHATNRYIPHSKDILGRGIYINEEISFL